MAPVLLMTALPITARACEAWDLSGPFRLAQSNNLTVTGEFRQTDGKLSGKATFFSPTLGDRGTRLNGDISGVVEGATLRFTVSWYGSYTTCSSECVGSSYSSAGVYEGAIAPDGRLSGLNWATGDAGHKVNWSAAAPATCKAAPQPAKPGLPIRHVGAATAAHKAQLCRSGYVWREARPADRVCVTPQSRARAAQENMSAKDRVDPAGGFGPASCKSGFVWREAFPGDQVCVTPQVRAAVADENAQAPSHHE